MTAELPLFTITFLTSEKCSIWHTLETIQHVQSYSWHPKSVRYGIHQKLCLTCFVPHWQPPVPLARLPMLSQSWSACQTPPPARGRAEVNSSLSTLRPSLKSRNYEDSNSMASDPTMFASNVKAACTPWNITSTYECDSLSLCTSICIFLCNKGHWTLKNDGLVYVYRKYIECSMCRFATTCSSAYASHMMDFHSGGKQKSDGWTQAKPMRKPMYCLCGYSSRYGNCIG